MLEEAAKVGLSRTCHGLFNETELINSCAFSQTLAANATACSLHESTLDVCVRERFIIEMKCVVVRFHLSTHTHTHTYTCTRACAHAHTHTHARDHKETETLSLSLSLSLTHTQTRPHMCICKQRSKALFEVLFMPPGYMQYKQVCY